MARAAARQGGMVARSGAQLFALGGEFADCGQEAEYLAERQPENLRHARWMFGLAAALNLLFLANDWRFHGQPYFPLALAARGGIVLSSLAGLLLAARRLDVRGLRLLCQGWSAVVIPACAVLVSPQTESALVMVFLLPVIFYLAVPLPFLWATAVGAICSAVSLAGFFWHTTPGSGTRLGIGLALLTGNTVLGLVLVRVNRLQRLAWASARAEQASGRELAEHRSMLQALLRAVPAPLVISARSTGAILQANDAARAYFGEAVLASPEALARCFGPGVLERPAAAIQPAVQPEIQPGDEANGHANGGAGQSGERECVLRLPDGGLRNVLLATSSVELRGGEAVLSIVVDITARKELERSLQRLASTDPLTGLANRTRFFARATEELCRTQRYGRPMTVLMIDIDHFKRINDSYGHEAGDRALRAFADLCREMVREADVVGRIGGEEFALLLPETGSDSALALAGRLLAAVPQLRPEGLAGSMTVSIGVSEVLPGEMSLEPALARADAALYTAKRAGRDRVELYA